MSDDELKEPSDLSHDGSEEDEEDEKKPIIGDLLGGLYYKMV